jgi:putative peptide zinc metalloprotease protein
VPDLLPRTDTPAPPVSGLTVSGLTVSGLTVSGLTVSALTLAALTVVADGDSYVVGSPHTTEYVAVPELGARIIEWLQQGRDVAECERRAAEIAGEPVDVADFLAVLADEGLFGDPSSGPVDGPPPVERVGAVRERAGRILFNRVAWTGYAVVVAVGLALVATQPRLRPSYRDGFPFSTQLANILVVTVLAMAQICVHEGAHVIATAAHGLRSSLSVTRRLYFLTFQADLTRLWSVPRRARYGPLLAGMTWDATAMTIVLALEATVAGHLSPLAVRLLRVMVLLQFTGLVTQTMIFIRTDVYALLVNATGCKTLWATKGALLRRYLRRTTPADERHLADTSAAELTWARRYLWLYVPGIAVSLTYLAYFALPAMFRVLDLCLTPIRAHGLTTVAAWEGAVALLIAFLPSVLTLFGAARSGVRVLRTAWTRRAG